MGSMVSVLNHGQIELEASCASDLAVVNAARVSLAGRSEWESYCVECQTGQEHDLCYPYSLRLTAKDSGLIGFLMRERHGTPFEHGYFRFRVKAPIFVFREWHRHRVGHSYNEWSARYSELKPEFYIPDDVVTQVGKPGAYHFESAPEDAAEALRRELIKSSFSSYNLYKWALENGIAKQQARLFLPVNIYSEMIWSVNPRSLMHFLGLRNAPQAQAEIRAYAAAAEDIFQDAMPETHAAFVQNNRTAP